MRAIIVVMDSLGVGAMPDAAEYEDAGTDTLGHILDNYPLDIPNLRKLGLGNIERPEDPSGKVAGGRLAVDKPEGVYGRFAEQSKGKDTITGHWEIAGIETKIPNKTYYEGFPQELMDEFVRLTGRGYLGNCVASGTEIIEELGDEHEATGKVIVYTSSDSVFQIAANTDVVPLEELYHMCEIARGLLVGEYACGRVIARPYIKGPDGKRVRTADRHDYALSPPEDTILDVISGGGMTVCSIGKIRDIFNGKGITEAIHTENNDDGVTKTIETMRRKFDGLIFTNLVDFDSKYGHRRDPVGYGKAIEEFDARLPELMETMGEDDILIITADHGNDPIHIDFNHTREYVFCLLCGQPLQKGVDLGTRRSFADIGATAVEYLTGRKGTTAIGESFLERIKA